MKYKIEFDMETKVVTKIYYGDIYLNDIIVTWEEAKKLKLIPKDTSGFLVDYRNANLNVPPLESHNIAAYYRANLAIFGNKKIAILSATSKNIVAPILVQELDQGYTSRPFSSYEAAIHWILS